MLGNNIFGKLDNIFFANIFSKFFSVVAYIINGGVIYCDKNNAKFVTISSDFRIPFAYFSKTTN